MNTARIRKEYLLAPGPTPVPPSVALAGAEPLYHHRTPRFEQVARECTAGMQELFCTTNDVIFLSASGSGAMEAAVANTLNPGDKAICVSGGKFGERWVKLCKAYGAEPIVLKIPYGAAINPEDVRKALSDHPDAKAVFTQLSETSTGCVYDIQTLGSIVADSKALFVVDGISGLGAEPCPADEWKIDILLTGSQKGLMIPPGLAFISVSEQAWAVIDNCTNTRFYFDLRAYKKSVETGRAPYTPATGLYIQLHKALEMLTAETPQGIWARHAWMGEATRAAITALGLEFFADNPGNVLTSVKVPDGVDGVALVKTMRDKYGVTVAGGQGDEMKGKLFRIAHLGYMDRFDVITAISAVEMTLHEMGHSITLGAGLAAAQAILAKEPS